MCMKEELPEQVINGNVENVVTFPLRPAPLAAGTG